MSDVAIVETGLQEPFVDWRAIVAGAVIASGISFILLAFGSAIGLSIASAAPSWRDSSPWLWLLSGIFLVFIALCSFGFGGYVAGRMRARARIVTGMESEFRDGMHGVLAWALGVLIGAVLTLVGAAAITSGTASAGAPGTSVTGEAIIAPELDELFRTNSTTSDAGMAYRRAEAARILMKSAGQRGIPPEDRKYLTQIVQNRAGVGETDAANRAGIIITKSADELHRARVAVVMQAFLAAAALLVGAATAWSAGKHGGWDREGGAFSVRNRVKRRLTV